MATIAKTDRKNTVKTQVAGSTVIFFDAATEGEIARLDVSALTKDMTLQTLIYGAKQVCSDVVSGVGDRDEKINGIKRAVASLGSGSWPKRPTAPVSTDTAILALMAATGMSREDVESRLGLAK